MPADNGMQEDILISKKDIIIDRDDVLGRGGYGHVFAGYMTDGKKVAVKLLIEQGALPERHIKDLRKESEKLKELTNHPNIIDLIGIIMEPDSYGLILEYMHFGTAFEFVRTFEVGLPLLLRMTCQVASAMMFLHTSHDPPMLHLDLKADNILIDKRFDAKVSDFGLSEWKTVTQMVTKGGSTSCRRCTITHIAPEILDNVNRKSTDRLDIYAFGITIWELFATDRPYGNVKESVIAEAVKNRQRPDLECLSANCPDIIRLMISKCWHHKPEKRPAFTVIFHEVQKAFETQQAGLNKALKAIRRQILEKYNVNDPQCLDTEYLDDLELGEEPEEMDYVTMETENRPVGEEMNLGPAEKERQAEPSILKPFPPLEYMPRAQDLSKDDLQLRKVLHNTLAFELIQSGQDSPIPLSLEMQKILRDPVKLRSYIGNDAELRFELLRSGSPLVSKLNAPSVQDNVHRGKCEQSLVKNLEKLPSSQKVRNNAPMEELTLDERRRVSHAQGLRNCSYADKLTNNGLGMKLLKALREPMKLKTALDNYESNKNGGQQKFETMERSVVEAAQDPFLLQILLAQDFTLLDNLMGCFQFEGVKKLLSGLHPELMMKLISANKTNNKQNTTTKPNNRGASNYRNKPTTKLNNPGASSFRNKATTHLNNPGAFNSAKRQPQQEQTESEQSNSLSGLKHMKMEDDNEPMEMSNSESREATIASKVKVEDAKTEGGTNQQKETKKEEKTAENQKKMQKMIEEARRKSEEEQRKRQKEQRKKWEQEKKRQEEERRKEEKKQKQEDNRKKKSDKGPNADQKADIKTENQNTGGRGGILGSLFGVFRGYHKESLIDSDTNRVPIPDQHDSLQSMDTHSIEADEMSSPGDDGSKLPVRSHGVPLQPRPGASPNLPSPTLKREPGTGNSNQQKADKSSPEQGPSNRASGGWDPPPRQTPPTGGATGVGGATGRAQNITISHAHAGGGFSHITIDPNMPTQPNIQVGNSNLMVIGGDTDSDEQERRENTNKTQKKKRRHREIKLPDQPLDMDRLDKVCIGIGKDWKKLCRELGLDDPLIEQIQEDYHINGTYEIMYQALHKWMQKNGKAATIKALGQHLCNIDRDDLMKKLK